MLCENSENDATKLNFCRKVFFFNS